MNRYCYRPRSSARRLALAAMAAAAFLLLAPLASGSSNAGKAFAQSSSSSSSPSMTVLLDKDTYKVGDIITATGQAPTKEPILIKVLNPKGDPYRIDQIQPNSDGSYSYKLKVGGRLAINGEFTVTVAYLGYSAQAHFTLTGGSEQDKQQQQQKPDDTAAGAAAAGVLKVTAKPGKKDTKVTVQVVDRKGNSKVSRVVFEVDASLAKLKVRAPPGWKADVKDGGKTVTFTASDKKVVKPGKKVVFRLPVVVKSGGSWTAFDGSAQLAKGVLVTGGKK
jgi:hypothetical protein